MAFRHAHVLRGVTFEVEFNNDGWLVAEDSTVVTGFDLHDLGSRELTLAPVRKPDLDLATGEEADVSVHALVGPDRRFDVLCPMESDGIDGTLHAAGADTRDVHVNTTKFLVLSSLHRGQ
jgi:hypothetical protein